jgi:F-type H+-transporting ATPase subunit b
VASETPHTHEGTAEPAHQSGLPQLRYEYWPGQIVWLLVIFTVLYVLLSKVFLPKVGGTLLARADRIASDMDAARALRDQAQAESEAAANEMTEARARARKTAADAKAKATAEAVRRQAALESELNARLAEAETRIRASRDVAMGQVRGVAAEIAATIAERLTGVAADPAEVEAAFAASGQA